MWRNPNTYAELQIMIRSVKLTSIYSTCVISSENPMLDHLLESSNTGFGVEIGMIKIKICTLSGDLLMSLFMLLKHYFEIET